MVITLEDIKNIENISFFYYLKYNFSSGNDIHVPESKRIYWGDIRNIDGRKLTDDISDVLIIPRYLQYGDYDDSCMVERSNHKLFLEDHKETSFVYDVYGGYGSTSIAIQLSEMLNPDNEEIAQTIIDTLNGLNDYPCLDDCDMSNMEYESFLESLDNYEIRDCISELSEKFKLDISDYDQDKVKELLLETDHNLPYPSYQIESGGNCYIDTKRLIEPITMDQLKPCLTDYEVITE